LTLLKKDQLETRTHTLAQEVKIQLTKRQQEQYEAIDKAATEYKRHVGKNAGSYMQGRYSGAHKSLMPSRILYWKGMLSRKIGCAIGSLVLRARAKKAKIDQHATNFQLTPQDIQTQIREAYKKFNRLKAEPD